MITQRKFTINFAIIIASALLALMLIVTLSFYNMSTQENEKRIVTIAELVKESLTAHMVNHIMPSREFFIKKVSESHNIDDLWIVRAPSVIKQYGKGFNSEVPRDEMDEDVISTGKEIKRRYETVAFSKLRHTVPYVASSRTNPNCMLCHLAKEGEVLGAISIVVDVTHARNYILWTLTYILVATLVIMLIVLFMLNRTLKPVWKMRDSIEYVMRYAKHGDYSKRVEVSKNSDSIQVAGWINAFLDKLENTISSIQENVKDFFISYDHHSNDPLLDIDQVILETSNIYKFKKTIEYDDDKFVIYERLAYVIKKHLDLNNFSIHETNNHTGDTICVYGFDTNMNKLDVNIKNRALKTRQVVISNQFENLCLVENSAALGFYLCKAYFINDNFDILIHFTFADEKELNHTRDILPKLDNYVNAIRSELISKNLTEILRNSSITDPLTKLYNRKYLDEFIEQNTAQAKRSMATYGVIMFDIDFFKSINDTYGHDIGDMVLKRLGILILSFIRDSDIAVRYGGEEFLLLLYNCDSKYVEGIANDLRINLSNEIFQINEKDSFTKTISAGYSMFPEDSDDIWKCIKNADLALYEAKQNGRNRVVKFVNKEGSE